MPKKAPIRAATHSDEGCLGTQMFGLLDALRMASRMARALGHAGPEPIV